MEVGYNYKTFEDRTEAASLMVPMLEDLKKSQPIVFAIPRGAVPMAHIIAKALEAPMDLVLVRKIQHPLHSEFAVGAVSESGEVLLTSAQDLKSDQIEKAALKEIQTIKKRRQAYKGTLPSQDPKNRVVIIVDDGIATGSTMVAAVRSLKAQGASRVVVAAPVASTQAVETLEREGAEVRVLYVPKFFGAVSYFYKNFAQVSDSEVGDYFQLQSFDIEIEDVNKNLKLKAILGRPRSPEGFVLFAHGSGSSRLSPRNQFLADIFNRQGIATLLADLLTEEESHDRSNVFNIPLLAERLLLLTRWVRDHSEMGHLPLGYLGASTGAAAAARAAAPNQTVIEALVSRGGRPDLAMDVLDQIKCSTLLIVGGEDHQVIELNKQAYNRLRCTKKLEIVPGATHLFEEHGALEKVADLSLRWFQKYFARARVINPEVDPPIYP